MSKLTNESIQRLNKSISLTELLTLSQKDPGEYGCPFCGSDHHVKIYQDKDIDIAHCAKCGKDFNTIQAYQEIRGLDFLTACREIAANKALPLEYADGSVEYPDGINQTTRQGGYTATKQTTGNNSTAYNEKALESANTASDDVPPHQLNKYKDLCNNAAADLYSDAGRDALDYLHGRGLIDETLKHYCVGYAGRVYFPKAAKDGKEPNRPAIIFPHAKNFEYYSARSLTDKYFAKPKQAEAGRQTLYNDYALNMTQPCFICEGEIDALSILQCGGNAAALCGTSGKNILIDTVKAEPPKCVLILALDKDEPDKDGKQHGQETQREIADELDKLRVPYINASFDYSKYPQGAPLKDANDLLRADPVQLAADVKRIESIADAVDAPNSDETPEGEQVQADDGKGAEIAADGVGNGPRSFYTHSVGEYLSGGQFEKDIDYFRKYKDRKTGYKVIDHYMTLFPGLAVLGGSSSLGKTTFAVNLCTNLIQQGETVLYFSLEQEPIEIITKILSRRLAEEYPDTPLTNIDIKNGATSEDLETVKKECAEEIGDHFQIIRCDFTVTADKICGIIKDYMTEYPDRRPVVVVDYLQLTAAPDDFRGDTRAAIDQNIKTFKACQRDNELFMILISSFNRANYETPASFEDFKESGLIEFTADYVWELQLSIMSTSDFYSTTGAKGGTRETTKKEKSDAVASQLKKKQRPVEFVSLKSRNGAQRYEAYFNYDVEHDLFTPDPGVLYAKDPDKASRIFADLYANTEPDPRLIKAYQEQAEPIDWTGVNPEYSTPFN